MSWNHEERMAESEAYRKEVLENLRSLTKPVPHKRKYVPWKIFHEGDQWSLTDLGLQASDLEPRYNVHIADLVADPEGVIERLSKHSWVDQEELKRLVRKAVENEYWWWIRLDLWDPGEGD